MSKIEDLIKQYCPNGCEWKRLGDVCDITSGSFVKKDKQSIDGRYLVYNGGITHTGYYDEYNTEADKVIISARGAGAGFVNHVMTRFWAGNSCFVLNIIYNTMLRSRFLYYVMTVQMSLIIAKRQEGSIPAVSKNQLMLLQIPIPHIVVQDEIVRILDKFTELEKELEKELELRRKQYEFYRDELLTFGDDVERKKLNDCCKNIGDGLHGTPVYDLISNYYFINGNNLKNKKIVIDEKTKRVNEESFIKYMLKLDSSTLLMSINGTIGNLAMYHGENVILGKSVAYMSVIDSVLRRDFLYYLLQTTHIKQSLFQSVTGGTIKNLGLAVIRNFKIPVPSLTEQERIVKILDKFDTLTTSLTFGLPAEIKLRKQQYEYYRDYLFGLLN